MSLGSPGARESVGQALAETQRTGFATFFSRTRGKLWIKGETSGNRLEVKEILVDCDEDTVLLKVKPDDGASDLPRAGSTASRLEELWRSLSLELHWNTPIYHNGYLYAFSGRNEPDAHFRCVEFKTGKLMWDRDERWQPHSTPTPDVYGRGSCTMADGKLIVLGEGGLSPTE